MRAAYVMDGSGKSRGAAYNQRTGHRRLYPSLKQPDSGTRCEIVFRVPLKQRALTH